MTENNNILCPISYEIMTDPVILTESGQTYERSNIIEWLSSKRTDPISRRHISSATLVINWNLRSHIDSLGHKLKNIEKDDAQIIYGNAPLSIERYCDCENSPAYTNIDYDHASHDDKVVYYERFINNIDELMRLRNSEFQ